MLKRLFCFAIVLYKLSAVYLKTYKCSGEYEDTPYCAYTVGDCQSRVIINAPHGGTLKPPDVPERRGGCYVNGKCDWRYFCYPKNIKKCKGMYAYRNDDNTRAVAKYLIDYLSEDLGVRPHFIRNNLHRSRVDANRDIKESTYSYPTMMKMYREYHDLIDKARAQIQGPGVFIELHGHTAQPAEEALLIIGYNIEQKEYANKTMELTPKLTIRRLIEGSKYSAEEIIRGDVSLGKFITEEGYDVEPSPAIPDPSKRKGYFSGGHNVMKYGSAQGYDAIDAIQIEIHDKFLRNNRDIKKVAKALSDSIKKWMAIHYNDLPAQNCDEKDKD